MKFLSALLLAALCHGQQFVPLRPPAAGAPPDQTIERGPAEGPKDRAYTFVGQPGLMVYLPKENPTGKGVIICPGGGYARVVFDKEGIEIAEWLNRNGVAAFVLKYRLPGSENMRPSMTSYEQATSAARVAIEDASETMRLVRANAGKYKVKADAIGMMGFSAGGHLAAMMGMNPDAAVRPDFLALIYPAIPKTLNVTPATPRTFLVHADDDTLSPADNSIPFYLALKKARVRAELHVYASGGHGFGIRAGGKAASAWTLAFETWVRNL